MRDYYTILEIEPGASVADIKKSYRRLAKIYHPDKTNNNVDAAIYFAEIKDAYNFLIHSKDRKQLEREASKWRRTLIKHPEEVVQKMVQIHRQLAGVDLYKTNTAFIVQQVAHLLSYNRKMLLEEKDRFYIEKIVELGVGIENALPVNHAMEVNIILATLVAEHPDLQAINESQYKAHRWALNVEKYKVLFILLFVILLCTLIYFLHTSK